MIQPDATPEQLPLQKNTPLTEGFEVTVIPSVSREEIVSKDPYLSFVGGLGNKASRSLGHVKIDQTNSIDPVTGENIPVQRESVIVSLGAKRPGVPGDIRSSRSRH